MLNQLCARRGDQRKNPCLFHLEPVRYRCKDVVFGGQELGVASVHQSHHLLPSFPFRDVCPEFSNFTSDITTENDGKLQSHCIFQIAPSYLPVDRVHTCRGDFHQDLIGSRLRSWDVFVAQLVNATISVHLNRLHGIENSSFYFLIECTMAP